MSNDSTRKELAEILQEAREYVRYSAELGIDGIESAGHSIAEPTSLSVEPQTAARIEQTPVKAKSTPASQPRTTSAISSTTTSIQSASQDSLFTDFAPLPMPAAPVTESLEDIWRDIGDCTRCGLCEGRTQVVNTNGNPKARLMFVGEAPGADEDAQGKPFVGRAGQLLTKMIEAMGLKREDVLIGNVNRCRPPANRQPTLEEAAICRPFLFREIATVQPEIIVVMGNTALRNLLEVREGITRVRGQFQNFRGIKVMPTFHPAYLLRDPSKKRETWEDLKKVRDHLDSSANAASQ